MFVVNYRKVWFTISALLLAASLWSMWVYGFKFSIDFTGGTITEASYVDSRPDKDAVEAKISELDLGGFSLRPSGDKNFVIRTKELGEGDKALLVSALSVEGVVPVIERQNTVGPTAGAELQSKAFKAIGVVLFMIVIFVTFAFRKVSRPVVSWKYGLATIIALVHDVVIPTGFFVYLGHIWGYEIDLLFVTGLLAILGYSVHDTIVVFDRVRENLSINYQDKKNEDFVTVVGKSVSQTFTRSINTSVTIFITLLALYIYGSSATESFALLLLVGVVVGTYSSIFVASPLLVTFSRLQKGK